MLRLTGHYPTQPQQINFDLLFQEVGGEWRLDCDAECDASGSDRAGAGIAAVDPPVLSPIDSPALRAPPTKTEHCGVPPPLNAYAKFSWDFKAS